MTDFELLEACKFSNRSWEEWLLIDVEARATSVAHMRVHQALEANVHDAYQQHSEAEQRRRARRGRR